MSRIRNIYQVEGVYLGVSPETGYNWVTSNGVFGNSGDFNLVTFVPRIQSVSYSIEDKKTEIKELGKKSLLWKANVENPSVSLNFEYLQYGVYPEKAMGFYTNFTEIYGIHSGEAHFPDNYNVNIIEGFTSRDLTREGNEIGYPYHSRDCRNIYIPIAPEGNDLNLNYYNVVHPQAYSLGVFAFGGAYLNSYKASASVGNFPKANVSYSCNNIAYYNSGKETPIPSIQAKNRHKVSGVSFTIPTSFLGDNLLSVLRPGDITLDINSTPKLSTVFAVAGTGIAGSDYSAIFDLGVNITDYKIQSYDLELNLNREPLKNLGYKLSIDNQVNFPVFVNLNISAIVGDGITGSLDRYTTKNDDYNLTIKLKNPINRGNKTAIQYDLRRAKLNNISYNSSIGTNKSVNLSFVGEIDPDYFSTKGFFMSGILNIETVQKLDGFLKKNDGFYLLKDDGGKIIIQKYTFSV